MSPVKPMNASERRPAVTSANDSSEIIFSESYYRLFPRVQRRINMDHFKDSCCRIRKYQNISTIKFDFSQKFLFYLSGIFLWSSKWKIKLHRRKSALNLQNKGWRYWHQFLEYFNDVICRLTVVKSKKNGDYPL